MKYAAGSTREICKKKAQHSMGSHLDWKTKRQQEYSPWVLCSKKLHRLTITVRSPFVGTVTFALAIAPLTVALDVDLGTTVHFMMNANWQESNRETLSAYLTARATDSDPGLPYTPVTLEKCTDYYDPSQAWDSHPGMNIISNDQGYCITAPDDDPIVGDELSMMPCAHSSNDQRQLWKVIPVA
ncbi:hypothetical protein BD309DRAFT_1082527 [Dichomitus squalens]|nr:hypothetical protein BD309DRAFT_1082527 [Dichomitus squalens]